MKQQVSKQERAYRAFRDYLRRARVSDFVGIMQLQDAIRREYGVDVLLRNLSSVRRLSDEHADLVIQICPELEIDDVSLSERVQSVLGL
ncbi:hypothetical protein GF391_02750 [Candidatus Uhrbacteria bacterium]|nr:hypothetical protein [Candidatus Uhrbacteria bacterium]